MIPASSPLERLRAIRAREQQATKGPWFAHHRLRYPGSSLSTHDQMCCSTIWGIERQVADCVDKYWESTAPEVMPEHEAAFPRRDISHDAEFMAHARIDIPYLLAENETLEAALALLREEKEKLEAQLQSSAVIVKELAAIVERYEKREAWIAATTGDGFGGPSR